MNAFFTENYTQKLFIAFKMAHSCCFGLRGDLDFPDFIQKKFYNINCWKDIWWRAFMWTFECATRGRFYEQNDSAFLELINVNVKGHWNNFS